MSTDVTMENARKPLHEILAMEEGAQADALRAFMDMHDTILVKVNSGKSMKVKLAGRELNIMPRGLRVSPRLGAQLLRGWGYRGKYWARERNTGLRKIDIPHLPPETKARYAWYLRDVNLDDFDPREDYLIHVPDDDLLDELNDLANQIEAAEAEQTAAAKK